MSLSCAGSAGIPTPYCSLTDHLRDSIASVNHQIDLLRSVHWGYLAPLRLSILLVFVDLRKWEHGITHILLVFGFGIALFLASAC